MTERFTTDEQLETAARAWNTATLFVAASAYAESLLHPHNWHWHGVLDLRWPGVDRLGKDDLRPMLRAAMAEMNRRSA